MNAIDLYDEVQQRVPCGAARGTRHRAEAVLTVGERRHRVVVAGRIDPKGQRREYALCDGIGIERPMLLRLTCPEIDCPQAMATRRQWDAFQARKAGKQQQRQPTLGEGPMQPIQPHGKTVKAGGHTCWARGNWFPGFTSCPNRAHPPMQMVLTGYDLFDEDGQCLAGGVQRQAGYCRPRLPNLQAVEAFLWTNQLQAMALLADIASRARDGKPR